LAATLSASIATCKQPPLNSLIYAGKLLASEQKRGEIFKKLVKARKELR
jgi:hypothetical protein